MGCRLGLRVSSSVHSGRFSLGLLGYNLPVQVHNGASHIQLGSGFLQLRPKRLSGASDYFAPGPVSSAQLVLLMSLCLMAMSVSGLVFAFAAVGCRVFIFSVM